MASCGVNTMVHVHDYSIIQFYVYGTGMYLCKTSWTRMLLTVAVQHCALKLVHAHERGYNSCSAAVHLRTVCTFAWTNLFAAHCAHVWQQAETFMSRMRRLCQCHSIMLYVVFLVGLHNVVEIWKLSLEAS